MPQLDSKKVWFLHSYQSLADSSQHFATLLELADFDQQSLAPTRLKALNSEQPILILKRPILILKRPILILKRPILILKRPKHFTDPQLMGQTLLFDQIIPI
jgi:hypothetical protein